MLRMRGEIPEERRIGRLFAGMIALVVRAYYTRGISFHLKTTTTLSLIG
jgi:hypothetical protein